MNRIYYRCRFTQLEPLRLGSGKNERTDADLLLDRRGRPFLPGSAIAGVLRSCGVLSEEENNSLFGRLLKRGQASNGEAGTSGTEARLQALTESVILISDAVLLNDSANVILRPRDGIALNELGTVKAGAKFDFEVAECSTPYTAIIELARTASPGDQMNLERVLLWAEAHGLSFGARSTRGFGRMAVEVRKYTVTSLADWLTFDPFTTKKFDHSKETLCGGETTPQSTKNLLRIELQIRMVGGYINRVYTTDGNITDANGNATNNAPDMKPLSAFGKTVITGTSWAGCFRRHMHELAATVYAEDLAARQQKIDSLFGIMYPQRQTNGKGKNKKRKNLGAGQKKHARSEITFSETMLDGSRMYDYTRIAVDRFTASPRSHALYTEKIAQGGNGQLSITLPCATEKWLMCLLAVTLNDLNLGLLTVGGESGVGRGRCCIETLKLNGKELDKMEWESQTGFLASASKQSR